MGKYVFIDRDGVINKDLWKYVETWDEFKFLPGALEALKKLTEKGYGIITVSNQAGIGDGLFTVEALREIDAEMVKAIRAYGADVADTYYCVHGKEEACECRKPKTGMFDEAFCKYPDMEKEHTFIIGDKVSDIEAGKNAGLKTILVLTGYGERDKDQLPENIQPDAILKDISHAVEYILHYEKEVQL